MAAPASSRNQQSSDHVLTGRPSSSMPQPIWFDGAEWDGSGEVPIEWRLGQSLYTQLERLASGGSRSSTPRMSRPCKQTLHLQQDHQQPNLDTHSQETDQDIGPSTTSAASVSSAVATCGTVPSLSQGSDEAPASSSELGLKSENEQHPVSQRKEQPVNDDGEQPGTPNTLFPSFGSCILVAKDTAGPFTKPAVAEDATLSHSSSFALSVTESMEEAALEVLLENAQRPSASLAAVGANKAAGSELALRREDPEVEAAEIEAAGSKPAYIEDGMEFAQVEERENESYHDPSDLAATLKNPSATSSVGSNTAAAGADRLQRAVTSGGKGIQGNKEMDAAAKGDAESTELPALAATVSLIVTDGVCGPIMANGCIGAGSAAPHNEDWPAANGLSKHNSSAHSDDSSAHGLGTRSANSSGCSSAIAPGTPDSQLQQLKPQLSHDSHGSTSSLVARYRDPKGVKVQATQAEGAPSPQLDSLALRMQKHELQRLRKKLKDAQVDAERLAALENGCKSLSQDNVRLQGKLFKLADNSQARIEALEAEVQRLKIDNDQLDKDNGYLIDHLELIQQSQAGKLELNADEEYDMMKDVFTLVEECRARIRLLENENEDLRAQLATYKKS